MGIPKSAAFALSILAAACTGGRGIRAERLDILTSFTVALSERDYAAAAALLSPGDQSALADPQNGILPEYRIRMRAMRLTTLADNPLIEVSHGRIDGIRDILPVLDQGAKLESDSAAGVPETGFAKVPAPGDPLRREAEAVRRTSASFFRSIRMRDWQGALAFVDPQERQGFLRQDGSLREETRRRLAEADTSAWDALTLKDGKLTGIVLIIPSR